MPAETPAAATVACLDLHKGANFTVRAKNRISGLRLIATDADWSHRDGPEVSGTGLSLLLAMTGRQVAGDTLAGAGVATLRTRLGGR